MKTHRLFALIFLWTCSAQAVQCNLKPNWQIDLRGIFYGLGPTLDNNHHFYLITSDYNTASSTLQAWSINGKQLYQFPIPQSMAGSPVIDKQDTAYFSNYKSLYAVNNKGRLKWSFYAEDFIFVKPLIHNKSGLIIFGTPEIIFAIDAKGNEVWRSPLTAGVQLAWIVEGLNGDIYAGSKDHRTMFAISETGAVKWQLYGKDMLTHFSVPALDVASQTIYIASYNKLIALNADGSNKWTLPLETYSKPPGPIYPPTIDEDGMIYLDGRENNLHYAYAIEPLGNIRWKVKLNDYSTGKFELDTSPILLADNHLAFIVQDSRLESDFIVLLDKQGNRMCNNLNLPASQLSVGFRGNNFFFSSYASSDLFSYRVVVN